MRQPLLPVVCLLAAVTLAPATGEAQLDYPLEVGAAVALGGSIDESDSGLGNTGYQASISLGIARRTNVGLRVGEIGYGTGERIGQLLRPTFSYVTVAGEYTFSERYYESGIYLGLGTYRLEGFQPIGGTTSDTSVGLVLGITGEFEVTKRLGFVVEVAGHLADFPVARYFATFTGGLGYHF